MKAKQDFPARRPTLQGMLKEALWAEGKGYQWETALHKGKNTGDSECV